MAIISKALRQDLIDSGYNSYVLVNSKDFYNNNVTEVNADEIIIYKKEPTFEMITLKLPKKKEVNIEWCLNKLNAESTYKNFTESFKQILTDKGYINNLNVYPTSYGIGVFVAVSFRDNVKEIKTAIDSILTELNIEYSNQSSNAGWVFRYVISKRKENIENLKLK